MHFREQTEKAFQLAADRNRKLLINRSSILGELMASILTSGGVTSMNTTDAATESIAEYCKNTLGNIEGVEEAIEDIASEHAMITDNFINSLRGDVTPTISEFAKLIENNLTALANNNASWQKELKIHTVDVPDPVVDYPDEFKLSEYNKKVYPKDWGIKFALDPTTDIQSQDDIYSLLVSGVNEKDDSIKQWLINANTALIAEAYRVVFSGSVNIRDIKALFAKRSTLANMDLACFIYLYADKLSKVPSENATGVSANDYIKDARMVRDIAGIQLSQGVFSLRSALKTKLLVLSRKDKSITVVRPLYEEYLSKGGTSESLLGSLLGESSYRKLDDMINAIFDDTNNYETIVRLRNARSDKSRAASVRSIAMNTFTNFTTTSSLTGMERRYCHDNLEIFREDAIERAKKVCVSLTDSDTMDINTVALKVITRSRFWYTDAEQYLTSMVEIKASNNDLTIDEVRFLATMQYVARFLATQVSFKKLY